MNLLSWGGSGYLGEVPSGGSSAAGVVVEVCSALSRTPGSPDRKLSQFGCDRCVGGLSCIGGKRCDLFEHQFIFKVWTELSLEQVTSSRR